jgi:hypothetical protein
LAAFETLKNLLRAYFVKIDIYYHNADKNVKVLYVCRADRGFLGHTDITAAVAGNTVIVIVDKSANTDIIMSQYSHLYY